MLVLLLHLVPPHRCLCGAAEAERPTREVFPLPDIVWGEVHSLGVSAAPGLEAVQHLAQHCKDLDDDFVMRCDKGRVVEAFCLQYI